MVPRNSTHFQALATGSVPKVGTKIAVALAHAREGTKEVLSALPKTIRSMETFGARAHQRNTLRNKTVAYICSCVFVVRSVVANIRFVVGRSATQVKEERRLSAVLHHLAV